MNKLIILLGIFVLAACARPHVQPPEEGEAARIWNRMEQIGAKGPYRIQLSMRFGEERETRRVTGILWGNDQDSLRLDVMAGVGAIIAMISEAGNDFTVYLPRENRAYFHEGSNRPLLKIGVPVPFDLLQLADLLNGHFCDVFGNAPKSSAMLNSGNARFTLGGVMSGVLEVNSAGEPVEWQQKTGGWQLSFTYDEDSQGLPKSLRLVNRNGKRAIILVKERENVAQDFDVQQLRLDVPAEAQMMPLEQFRTAK